MRDRLYADFLMRSRLAQYRRLLESTLAAGYEILAVERMWRLISEDAVDPARRYVVLRHDVDTDPGTASAMWDIERDLGVRSSFYFRLSTLDPGLMAAIVAGGGEASYHYEELATVAKRRGLRSRDDALAHVPEARDEFAANLARVRAVTGLPVGVVAAHGDFANRRLGIANWVVLEEPGLRRQLGIELEAYDRAFLGRFESQHSDVPYPRYWTPTDPATAIGAGARRVFVLVHPRHWRTAPMINARDDVRRVIEGARLALAAR